MHTWGIFFHRLSQLLLHKLLYYFRGITKLINPRQFRTIHRILIPCLNHRQMG